MSIYKNLLNTFAMTIVSYCLASVIWMMWGYTIAFGPDRAVIIGGLNNLFLSDISVKRLSGTIPTYIFVMFQMTFAGGTVVHIHAGVAGLVLALVVGKRIGYGKEAMFPSSISLTCLGAGLLVVRLVRL